MDIALRHLQALLLGALACLAALSQRRARRATAATEPADLGTAYGLDVALQSEALQPPAGHR